MVKLRLTSSLVPVRLVLANFGCRSDRASRHGAASSKCEDDLACCPGTSSLFRTCVRNILVACAIGSTHVHFVSLELVYECRLLAIASCMSYCGSSATYTVVLDCAKDCLGQTCSACLVFLVYRACRGFSAVQQFPAIIDSWFQSTLHSMLLIFRTVPMQA